MEGSYALITHHQCLLGEEEMEEGEGNLQVRRGRSIRGEKRKRDFFTIVKSRRRRGQFIVLLGTTLDSMPGILDTVLICPVIVTKYHRLDG